MVIYHGMADGITVDCHHHCYGVLVARRVAAYQGDVVTVLLAMLSECSEHSLTKKDED